MSFQPTEWVHHLYFHFAVTLESFYAWHHSILSLGKSINCRNKIRILIPINSEEVSRKIVDNFKKRRTWHLVNETLQHYRNLYQLRNIHKNKLGKWCCVYSQSIKIFMKPKHLIYRTVLFKCVYNFFRDIFTIYRWE